MKKQLILTLTLVLLLSGCKAAEPQEIAAETTASVNEDTETRPADNTAEKNEAVTAGENQVIIEGRACDKDTEELYLSVQLLTDEDADALSQMTNLLWLELNLISDEDIDKISTVLSKIEDFSDITLVLSEAYVSDLSFLEKLPKLKSLRIVFSDIKDYSALENIQTLESLSVRSSGINDYSQFGGLTNITELDLGEGAADDLSPLSELTGLKTLRLDHSTLGGLSPLTGLTGLEELDISYTNVSDISPLSSMTGLRTAFLHDTAVADISPLASTELSCISICYDNADYIDTLNKMKYLGALIIDFTGTNDVLSLSSLTGLDNIYIFCGPDVSEEDIEALRQALPSCEINVKVIGEDE